MPREKKGSTKIKAPTNPGGNQPKSKKRRTNSNQVQNNQNLQPIGNNYGIGTNLYDEYQNNNPNNQMMHSIQQINGPRQNQNQQLNRMGMQNMQNHSMQPPQVQRQPNQFMQNCNMMMQSNFGPSQMNGNPNGSMTMQPNASMNIMMNGPPTQQITNYNQQMMPNNVSNQININQNINSAQSAHPKSQLNMMPIPSGKVYPPDQKLIKNTANPNAPPIYPCGTCHKEVHENEHGILCESGCNFWYHQSCTGLTESAFNLLKTEVFAEWACEFCVQNKNIPPVKFKP